MPTCASFKTIKTWIQINPGPFGAEETKDTLTLVDMAWQKMRIIERHDIFEVHERHNKQSPQQSYLLVVFQTGEQLVLAAQGFAFAPDTTHTGPLALPLDVVCMQDYHHMVGQLLQLESERRREAIDIIMLLVALLDGAKKVGLEVGREEREVERYLERVEKGLSPSEKTPRF
jgi:hypothetical protein